MKVAVRTNQNVNESILKKDIASRSNDRSSNIYIIAVAIFANFALVATLVGYYVPHEQKTKQLLFKTFIASLLELTVLSIFISATKIFIEQSGITRRLQLNQK